jgi:hypothetical protein
VVVPWYLNIKTVVDHHVVQFGSQDEAKQALAGARAEVFEHPDAPGGYATIEDQVVVPRSDVTAITVHEAL